jgi:hypothetical protein
MDADDLLEEIDHKRELIKEHTKRLRVLERQAVRLGAFVPPHIQLDIDDLKEKIIELGEDIEKLQARLDGHDFLEGPETELSHIRQQMILAKTADELQFCLLRINSFLERFPNYVEALSLKHTILRSIERSPVPITASDTRTSLTSLLPQIINEILTGKIIIPCLAAIFIGGVLWSMLNILLRWAFFLGGSGNEPSGFTAFLWGFVTLLPIVICVLWAGYQYISSDETSFLSWVIATMSYNDKLFRKWITATILYAICGGIGAFIFYSFGFRVAVESLGLGYAGQELIIVLIWSFLIALSTYLPLLILQHIYNEIISIRYLAYQIPLTMAGAFVFVLISLIINLPEEQVNQLRGFLAGVGLRAGLFLGFFLSIYMNQYRRVPVIAQT